jgi:hypothetical protein
MADGMPLTTASGDNTNALTQPYVMPDPIVADKSKIPSTTLPTSYLYDIPTTAGQEIELINISGTVGIVNAGAAYSSAAANDRLFKLNGQPATESYRGIIVKNGMKYSNR